MPTKTTAIDPETAEKLLRLDLLNIARKVKEGKTLTAVEKRRLDAATNKLDEVPKHAKSIVELAKILGVERHTVQRWRKLDGAPKAMPSRKHDVEAWRTFQSEIGGKGAIDDGAEIDAEVEGLPKESILRRKKLALYCEEKEIQLAATRSNLLEASLVRETWNRKSNEAAAMLKRHFNRKLAKSLEGAEAPDILEALVAVYDELIKAMHGGKN